MRATRVRAFVILTAGGVILALLVSTVVGLVESDRSAGAVPPERLPDLDQEVPSDISVRVDLTQGRRSFQLGFRSAVVNVGAGPLLLDGGRRDTKSADMVVDQLIDRPGMSRRVVSAVGRMKYAVSKGHQHWHYLGFDRYELRRAEPLGTSAPLLRDRKTGFCLGDRYRASGRFPARPPAAPAFTGRCGRNRPDLLRMGEGMSVGYGDDYSGFLEGQQLPLDGLPNGRYVLVHRVNADAHLEELSYGNNAASALLDIQWQHGTPSVRVVATCPDTDRCDRPASAA